MEGKSLRFVARSSTKFIGIVLVVCLGLLLVSFIVFENAHKQGQMLPKNEAIGVNVDITAMIPGTPYTVAPTAGSNFFDLASRLGINTLRITDIRWETTGIEYSRAEWVQVFDEAQQHHIRIVLLLMDGVQEYSVLQQAHTLLGDYGLARAPALGLIDLYNEPDVSDAHRMMLLNQEAAYAHHVAPAIPLTIGGWKVSIAGQKHKFAWQEPADISKFIHLVNVISAHLYQFDQATQQGIAPQQWTRDYLSAVRLESQNKPILLEEFGASNGLAPTDEATPTGSKQWQACIYRGVLQEVLAEHDQDIIGALAWIIAPRPAIPGAISYERDMTGWSIVLDDGQRILPAASAFSPQSLLASANTDTLSNC